MKTNFVPTNRTEFLHRHIFSPASYGEKWCNIMTTDDTILMIFCDEETVYLLKFSDKDNYLRYLPNLNLPR